MKRLLRIGFNTLIQSLIPILCWFLLGQTIDANIFNVFSITYPIQCIAQIIKEIFGTGANIKKEKENNPNAVLSGITIGSILGIIICVILCFLAKPYISYMSMDVNIYYIFVIYSFIEIFLSLIFQLVIEKLYFEDKEKTAIVHTIIFNLINIVFLVFISLTTKNQIIIISITLSALLLYIVGILIWQFHKFKLDFNFLTNIKYESNDIVASGLMFISYFIGFGTIFSAGIEYAIAMNFVTIICDCQWDACEAMSTVAKIDIVHDEYNLKRHIKQGLIYTTLLTSTVLIAFMALFNAYDVTFKIGIYFLLFQLADFYLGFPLYVISPFIQLKYSATKNTVNEILAYSVRTILSVTLPIVFCCDIGQFSASLVSILFYTIVLSKHFKTTKDGQLIEKQNLHNNQPTSDQ